MRTPTAPATQNTDTEQDDAMNGGGYDPGTNDDDDNEDMPPVASSASDTTPEDEKDDKKADAPVEKSIDLSLEDLYKGMTASVQTIIEPLQVEIAGLREENRTLRTQVVNVTKAINANTTSVDGFGAAQREIVKSLADVAGLATLVKGLSESLTSGAEGSAATRTTGVAAVGTVAAGDGPKPGDTVAKGGVGNPLDTSAASGAVAANGGLTAEEQAEYPRIMSKALQLTESGRAVPGFEQLRDQAQAGRISGAAFRTVKAAVTA